MTIRITIIGLDQIGASIGLALAGRGEMFHRIGHDRNLETARRAQKLGAIDQVAINLPSAVKESEVVILAVPLEEMRATLEAIAQDLKENAVVMDTGPVKVAMATWAGELLPEKRHYIGLTPVISPTYLRQLESGLEAARPDLFQRGMFAIVSPPNTSAEALQLAADLAKLLGADLLFADPLELDSLVAATYTLPQLVAAALLNATVDRPGWREARKLAGQSYADATAPGAHYTSAKSLGSAALLNQANVLRVLDGTITALQALRDDIENNDASSLETRLENAQSSQARWLKERLAANWASEGVPESLAKSTENYNVFSRLFGGGLKRKDHK
jgi:prephenate dehydrogenase